MSTKKILFLHGYAQSASIFSAKTGGLRKTLKKLDYEAHYIQGPLKLKGDQLHDPSFDELDLYGWWPFEMDRYEVQNGINAVLKEVENLDNIVGIIGFSQGAGLSSAISTKYKEWIPTLKWCIFFSGFKVTPCEHWYEPKIDIPTLHVLGELDTVMEESRCIGLYDACEDEMKHMLRHQGGHFVPNNKDFVNKIVAWIQATASETSEKKDDKNAVDDDDLMTQIDNMGKV